MSRRRRSWYLSKPNVGEIIVALVITTSVATLVASLFGHPEAGLMVGPVVTALYYAYTWPAKTNEVDQS